MRANGLCAFVASMSVASMLVACAPGTVDTGRTPSGGDPGGGDVDPGGGLHLMDGGGGGDPPPPERDAGPSTPPPPPPPTYPRGPYGTDVGDVMPEVFFTGADGSEVTMGALRSDPSVRVIVWISSVEWCGACRDASPEIDRQLAEYGPQGVVFLESLHEDQEYQPATTATAQRWTRELGATYLVVVEPSPPYQPRSVNPMTWIIDAETMVIRNHTVGAGEIVNADIESALSRATR